MRTLLTWLLPLWLLAACAPAAPFTVVPAGDQGFDVRLAGKLLAPLRLSSNGVLRGTVRGLRITGLHCTDPQAVAFTPDSFVALELPAAAGGAATAGAEYPVLRFRLALTTFSADRWRKLFDQPAPFHFLSCAMPTAQVWHQRGWLNATPLADPFPLLLDKHVGTPEISCLWNRNWSYLCPMGGSPIPMIGAWDPTAQLYVGYDFQPARATDQSDRYVAAGYCWQQGADQSFFALAYPHGGLRYGELVLPKAGDVIESHCDLVIDPRLPDTEDPNERFQQRLFARWGNQLPRVEETSDVGWVAGQARMADFLGNPNLSVFGSGGEQTFYPPGTLLLGAWGGHRELPIASALRRGDRTALEGCRRKLDELLTRFAKRFPAGGEPCLSFEKPLAGAWHDTWGGAPVTTTHSTEAFYMGRLLIGLTRLDQAAGTPRADYLAAIDQLYNWAKHFVWSRNEFADVPSSPFAIGGTLSTAFLLDYYHAFRDDPTRRERARAAVTLANRITWRYLAIWAMDSDRYDAAVDGSFLCEPNSGRDWAGLACANEVFWNIDTLCQAYVHSGDPRMRYYLRGIAQRWPQLYRPVGEERLADCDHKAMTEGFGLFDGAGPGRGERYAFGWHDELAQCCPVGASNVRIVAGPAAVIEFGRDGSDVRAIDYRTDGQGACSFQLQSRQTGEFDVSFSYPLVDLTDVPVVLVRHDEAATLGPDRVRRPGHAPSNLYLTGLRAGDWIHLGTVPPGGQPQTFVAPHAVAAAPAVAPPVPGFVLAPAPAGAPLPRDWRDTTTFAGLEPGVHWCCGVPYQQGLAATTERLAVSMPASARGAAVAYTPVLEQPLSAAPTLVLDDGRAVPLGGRPVKAWQAWPPMFKPVVLLDQAELPAGRRVVAVEPHGTRVQAVSWSLRTGVLGEPRRQAAWDQAAAAYAAELSQREQVAAVARRLAVLPATPIAVIPPVGGDLGVQLLSRFGLAKQITRLTPEQLVDPAVFTPTRYPVAVYAGFEDYLKTVRTTGDGAAAVIRYLHAGGTLVSLAPGPLPFYYVTVNGTNQPEPLLPRLGVPLGNGWELAPAGLTLQNLEPATVRDVGPTFGWPKGDPRLRSVKAAAVDPAHTYRPLVRVRQADGSDAGDAAFILKLGSGPAAGGTFAYVWSTLLDAPQGVAVVAGVMEAVLRAASLEQPPGR